MQMSATALPSTGSRTHDTHLDSQSFRLHRTKREHADVRDIRCTLETSNLQSPSDYFALSHIWGLAEHDERINTADCAGAQRGTEFIWIQNGVHQVTTNF